MECTIENVLKDFKKQFPDKDFELLTSPEDIKDIYTGVKSGAIKILEKSANKPVKIIFEGTNPCPYYPQVQCEYCGCNETDFEIIYTCELPKKKQCPHNIIYW